MLAAPGSIKSSRSNRGEENLFPARRNLVLWGSMHTLKLICLTVIRLTKGAWLLPKSIGNAVKHRRQQAVLDELEAERLDRIRNPSKYLGK